MGTDADFRRLWPGHTISQFGTQIGLLAIPLTAAITLDEHLPDRRSPRRTTRRSCSSAYPGAWVDNADPPHFHACEASMRPGDLAVVAPTIGGISPFIGGHNC
jgi:hypothetical protein